MPPTPLAPTRSNGVTAPTVQTRIRRPCESRRICIARNRICNTTTPISRNKLLWREGMATMAFLENGNWKLENRNSIVELENRNPKLDPSTSKLEIKLELETRKNKT